MDNYIESDVLRIIMPLYIGQYITFSPKYSIRYNFVTSNISVQRKSPKWGLRILFVFAMVMKSFMLVILLSMECENFHLRVKNAYASFIMLFDGEEVAVKARMARTLAEAAVRMRRQPWLSACGLFTVDAALPLRLLSVVATYTIVVLQFYFL
ncbi:uncharacterized protein [Battus philenor]|uniref:uncharacterized protein n=1 Tax=Battus philenor TaxID=42288 RepID=UPI0035CF9D58